MIWPRRPCSTRRPPANLVTNEAGGKAYALTPKQALAQHRAAHPTAEGGQADADA
jgi:hypothetical protein